MFQPLAGYRIHENSSSHNNSIRASPIGEGSNGKSGTFCRETGPDQQLCGSQTSVLKTRNLITVHIGKCCQVHRCQINLL